MGLDNGIIIRGKTEKGKKYLINYFAYLLKDYENNSETVKLEFGYWRKCWNIRKKFIDDFGYDAKEQEIRFELDDIPAIIETLKYFLNEDNWAYKGEYSQVFSWIEELPSIANAMRDLWIFYDYLDSYSDNEFTDEDFEIYFYDSY